ncbi:MAG: glycosylasparaginase [Bacteroidetes bacterium]|nr:MAG: glycosylasparaginase [Bacteroidota bacterium]
MLGSETLKNESDGASLLTTKATMVSTWNHGVIANEAGFKALKKGGSALDMIEEAARIVEADADGLSVGIGGLPDRDGVVTLDACCMDHKGRAGSVGCIEDIMHPLSVARKVMEETPHVMLVGEGAKMFAIDQGFIPTNLLTEKALNAWQKWKEKNEYNPVINRENHDTIGILALDNEGRLSGGCTTSGVSYKMHGRVGDSPIIGAGLFVDGNVGAATATGLGEAVMRTVGSFLVVELMRGGLHPQAACEQAVKRIIDSMDVSNLQVGYLALDKQGRHGAHAVHEGFNYALTTETSDKLIFASNG